MSWLRAAAWVVLVSLGGCLAPTPLDSQEANRTPDSQVSRSPGGNLQGIVVDEAIRPLADAQVVLMAGQSGNHSANTDLNGRFMLNGLAAGSYLVSASKPGYTETRQLLEVAEDGAVPHLNIQLASIPGAAPYVQSYKFSGFMECGLSVVAACSLGNGLTCGIEFAPCSGNITNDRFTMVWPIDRPPSHIQSEMAWETTTAASDHLRLYHSRADKAEGFYNGTCICWAEGPSPLLMATNQTEAAREAYGTWNDLELRVFAGSVEGTGVPAEPNGCYRTPDDLPVPPRQYCGLGYSFQQTFTVFTHVFYGYAPPPEWRFTQASGIPPPPA